MSCVINAAIDADHPLAGQTIRFETPEEIKNGQPSGGNLPPLQ